MMSMMVMTTSDDDDDDEDADDDDRDGGDDDARRRQTTASVPTAVRIRNMLIGRSRCGTRSASLSREASARRCARHACDARPTQGTTGATPSR
eukprot:2768468-Pyramimonas_sp.AAC.1